MTTRTERAPISFSPEYHERFRKVEEWRKTRDQRRTGTSITFQCPDTGDAVVVTNKTSNGMWNCYTAEPGAQFDTDEWCAKVAGRIGRLAHDDVWGVDATLKAFGVPADERGELPL